MSADQVGVMYLGRLVEVADKRELFATPRHPYTRMLLDAIPDMHMSGRARTPVQGEVPNPLEPADRLRVPSALPACQRALQGRAARCCWRSAGVQVACHAVEEGRDLSRAGMPVSCAAAVARRRTGRDVFALADQPGIAAVDHHLGARGRGCCSCSPSPCRRRRPTAPRAGRRPHARARARGRASRPIRRPGRRRPSVSGRRVARARSRRWPSRRRRAPGASGRSSPRRRCRSSSRRRA